MTKGTASSQAISSVLIVDDHPIVRQGLTELINCEKDIKVCGQAANVRQAMDFLRKNSPDVIIVDLSLENENGLELIKDVKISYPDVSVLVLSMHDESLYAERVLRAGAKGYVMKQQATENVIVAIRKILAGELFMSDEVAGKMVRKMVGGATKENTSPVDCLSDRELEVFLLIGKGLGTRQIAERFHLSVKTIETYRAHIKQKLNLDSAANLLQYAIHWVKTHDLC
jgi:DNA-binding NarL/FixJ family response regulator